MAKAKKTAATKKTARKTKSIKGGAPKSVKAKPKPKKVAKSD